MILRDEFEDGVIYSETKIAEEIGISRTPIRDALQRLNQEGFIDTFPSKGFKIREFTENDIIELYQIRTAIEGFCALLIAREHNKPRARETINQLENYLNLQKELSQTTQDIQAFYEADQKFHLTIVDYAGNSEFSKLFRNYLYRIKKLALHSLQHPGRLQATMQEHIDIFNAISTGSISDVYAATLVHMENPSNINLEDLSSGGKSGSAMLNRESFSQNQQ